MPVSSAPAAKAPPSAGLVTVKVGAFVTSWRDRLLQGIGIEFNDMLMESYLHLRNLVKCRRDVPNPTPWAKIPHMASLRWRQLAGPC